MGIKTKLLKIPGLEIFSGPHKETKFYQPWINMLTVTAVGGKPTIVTVPGETTFSEKTIR